MQNQENNIKKAKAYESKRFILTAVVVLVLTLASLFPMYIINKASEESVYDLTAAWTAWGIIYSGIVTAAANYVIKESNKPSFIGFGGMVSNIPSLPKKKILENYEDESDPEDIPL